jgi:hypothetical protein
MLGPRIGGRNQMDSVYRRQEIQVNIGTSRMEVAAAMG